MINNIDILTLDHQNDVVDMDQSDIMSNRIK
jgi:hypothetical protein